MKQIALQHCRGGGSIYMSHLRLPQLQDENGSIFFLFPHYSLRRDSESACRICVTLLFTIEIVPAIRNKLRTVAE
jgi:hypothetical protein